MHTLKNSNSKPIQLKFDFDNLSLTWPPNKSFPLNIPDQRRTVLQEINKDIEASDEYLERVLKVVLNKNPDKIKEQWRDYGPTG